MIVFQRGHLTVRDAPPSAGRALRVSVPASADNGAGVDLSLSEAGDLYSALGEWLRDVAGVATSSIERSRPDGG